MGQSASWKLSVAPRTLAGTQGDDEEVTVSIEDAIGKSWDGEGATAKELRKLLPSTAKRISVDLMSGGGSAVEGLQIYNVLKEHPAHVTVNIGAYAASAATVIAMAGDDVTIAPNGIFMVHGARSLVSGTSDDLRKEADVLDMITGQAIDLYSEKSHLGREKIAEIVKAETYMTAKEALANGFVDRIRTQKADVKQFASLTASMCTRELPASVREHFEAEAQQSHAAEEQQKETNMNDLTKTLLAAAGVTDEAGLAQRVTHLLKLESTIGAASAEEAVGIALAWKSSHEALPKLQGELAQLKADAEGRELDAALAKARDEKRVTPALEAQVREQLKSGDMTLKGAQAMLAALAPIPALDAGRSQSEPGATAAVTQLNGKTFAQLSGAERAALRKQDPTLYDELKKAGN